MKITKSVIVLIIFGIVLSFGTFVKIQTSKQEGNLYTAQIFDADGAAKQRPEQKISEQPLAEPKTVLFVGDIMLDRGVEHQINKNGGDIFYPFEKISKFLQDADNTVGNLEGPIVENPPHFSDDSMKFAFASNTAEALFSAGFNMLSLANNHTQNMGNNGIEEARMFLTNAGIAPIGHPVYCGQYAVFKKDNFIFLAFNKTFHFNCSDDELAEIVKQTKNFRSPSPNQSVGPGRFLIIILHWGAEYEPNSSTAQQELAHKLIDSGADLIIGSHPHIVQEIEVYKNKLIFYSLGNFIFDQFFSEQTQQSLAVKLELYPDKLIYHLFPIDSQLAQPFLMEKPKAGLFLRELAQKSSVNLTEKIEQAVIELKR